jgi:hypothetical protein
LNDARKLPAILIHVFPEHQTIVDLSAEALDEFYRGLGQALDHLASQGVYSFNLAWFPANVERRSLPLIGFAEIDGQDLCLALA